MSRQKALCAAIFSIREFLQWSADALKKKKKTARIIEAKKYIQFFQIVLPGNTQKMKMCFENKHSQKVSA